MRRRFAAGFALLGAACIALLATGPRAAEASVVKALSLEELTRKSNEILVGMATEQQSRRHIDGKLIVTDFSFHVEDVLKGESKRGEPAIITVLGGKLDGLGLQVPGEASFAIGQRVIAFLYKAPRSGDLRVVGMSQGVLSLKPQADGSTMVIPGGNGAALLDPGQGNAIQEEGGGALAKPEPLPLLLDRIKKIVASQRL
jgi:hypothetical protein